MKTLGLRLKIEKQTPSTWRYENTDPAVVAPPATREPQRSDRAWLQRGRDLERVAAGMMGGPLDADELLRYASARLGLGAPAP